MRLFTLYHSQKKLTLHKYYWRVFEVSQLKKTGQPLQSPTGGVKTVLGKYYKNCNSCNNCTNSAIPRVLAGLVGILEVSVVTLLQFYTPRTVQLLHPDMLVLLWVVFVGSGMGVFAL
ncbi:MAG: hypothetical protein RPU59_07755 [Candidatus Sedimenticola sp. (ex Thyasira tokunagai)]